MCCQSAHHCIDTINCGPQSDGTMDGVLESTEWLELVLQRLSGGPKGRHRDPDDQVRESLAEAVQLMVTPAFDVCKVAAKLA